MKRVSFVSFLAPFQKDNLKRWFPGVLRDGSGTAKVVHYIADGEVNENTRHREEDTRAITREEFDEEIKKQGDLFLRRAEKSKGLVGALEMRRLYDLGLLVDRLKQITSEEKMLNFLMYWGGGVREVHEVNTGIYVVSGIHYGEFPETMPWLPAWGFRYLEAIKTNPRIQEGTLMAILCDFFPQGYGDIPGDLSEHNRLRYYGVFEIPREGLKYVENPREMILKF